MANSEHLEQLKKGLEAWNEWRKQNPAERPDLSGLNLTELVREPKLITRTVIAGSGQKVITGIDFRNVDLRGSTFSELSYKDVDFRGADLSETAICDSTFRSCWFADDETLIREKCDNSDPGRLSKQDRELFASHAARLDKAYLYGTCFEQCRMSFVDLTTAQMDEKTRFDATGVIGARVTRRGLELLTDYGGLTKGRMVQMEIVDDVATLRQTFGGFWNWIHFLAMSAFLFPYVWFLVTQWMRANVGEDIPDGAVTNTILGNLCRFIVSGGETWRRWRLDWIAVPLFVIAMAFNALRAVLFFQTKRIEHLEIVSGLPSKFRLEGAWLRTYKAYCWLAVIALFLIVVHTGLFMLTPAPE